MGSETTVESVAAALERKIVDRTARVGIIGLGYVGLPLAVEFGNGGIQSHRNRRSAKQNRLVNQGESYIQDISESVLPVSGQ